MAHADEITSPSSRQAPACPGRYNLGVQTLRTASWDATLGFNRSGRPSASIRAAALARGDAVEDVLARLAGAAGPTAPGA